MMEVETNAQTGQRSVGCVVLDNSADQDESASMDHQK